MSLPAANYTPPGGYVPQAQQFAQGQPNATNTQAPANTGGSMMGQLSHGQELSPTQLSSLSGSYANAANQLGNMQTSDARQGYMDNSNLPAMQSNYDDLARKLFEYDQGTLSPQLQGQNPGTSPDAPAFGRVDASPLGMTMAGAGLPAGQGLYNPNPKYAYTAQIDQGNDISSLLDTLNKAVGQEFSQRAGTYRNTVDKQTVLLKAISDIMDQNRQTSLANKQMQTQKDLEAMRLGYTNQYGGAIQGLTDVSKLKTKSDQAQYLRDSFNNAQTIGERKRIADTAKQMGISLTPKDLNDKARVDVGSDMQMIQKIQGILNVMDQHKKDFPTGYQAHGRAQMSTIGLGEVFGGNADVNKALTDMSNLKLDVERLKGGVRAAASPQLYEKLKKATIDVGRSTIENRALLKDLMQAAQTDLQLIANEHQYTDTNDMANNIGITMPNTASKVHITNGSKVLEFNQDDPEIQKALQNGWRMQ